MYKRQVLCRHYRIPAACGLHRTVGHKGKAVLPQPAAQLAVPEMCIRDRLSAALLADANHLAVLFDVTHTHGLADVYKRQEHRGVNAVNGKGVDIVLLDDSLFVALCGHIAATLVESQLHNELGTLAQSCNVPLRVQNFEDVYKRQSLSRTTV